MTSENCYYKISYKEDGIRLVFPKRRNNEKKSILEDHGYLFFVWLCVWLWNSTFYISNGLRVNKLTGKAKVVNLKYTSVCQAKGRGFKSLRLLQPYL